MFTENRVQTVTHMTWNGPSVDISHDGSDSEDKSHNGSEDKRHDGSEDKSHNESEGRSHDGSEDKS